MPIFYYLPKIHKCLANPLGRPIIAGIGSLTSNLSQYVDRQLQKHVPKLNSYLKDTTSILRDLCDLQWDVDFQFATLNVTSLYTSIPLDKGIFSVKKKSDMDGTMPTKQKTGTTMGTRFAPRFAHLYVGDFKQELIYGNHEWKDNIKYFKRYIDDLILFGRD